MKKIMFKKILPIAILAILVCLYFFNIIAGKNFLWEDFPVYYFPVKSYVFNSLKNSQIPLWNPNLNLGYPIVADTTAAIFYPLNWLAIPFMVNKITTDYFIIELWAIFHLFLAGVFMYYLINYLTQENKEIKKQENKTSFSKINTAALFAAIAFMFSGFFIGHLKHVAQITTACWLPLIFLFLYKSFKEKKYSCAIYAGIFWGISILSGHLQIAYHFSLFLGLFILWEIIFSIINKKNYKKIIITSLIAIIIAISLSAIQTLPFLEFLNNSTRNKITASFASSFSLKPTEFFINLFLPHNFGGFKPSSFYFGYGGAFWETSIYVGILTLFLALIALIKSYSKNQFILFLILSSIICLSLAFGGYSFVHPLFLNIIPGLNMIRAPVRFVLPVIFSICILSGFGFNYFINFLQQLRDKEKDKCEYIVIKLSKVLKFISAIILGFLLFLIYLTTKYLEISGLLSNLITLNFSILIISIVIYLYLKKYLAKKSFATILIFILFLDIFIFGWQFNNGVVKPIDYYPGNEITELSKAESPLTERIINDDYLMPNSAYIYNTPIMGSNHYMIIKDYYDFTNGLAENLYYFQKYRNFNNFFENKTKLNLLGIRYIISDRDLSKWFSKKNLTADGNKNIYENNNAWPRFLLSKKSISIKNPQKILNLLNDVNYDPKELIYINERYNEKKPIKKADIDNIDIVKYEKEYIKLEIENTDNNWLLANEIYYPGWQAKVNGKKTKIYKANYTFRAIPIPTGNHTIEFIFKPTKYLIGKWTSFSAIIVLITFGLANLIHKINKRRISKKKPYTKLFLS